ncbi:2-keto-4-pentenoate hydratase [Sandaracinobacteroides hominis]|uniref:2-keto-4-pentenoate hydratase n=1 Tax=Sandaracinobacteroides hominis TaxID=2780086 RepID=UPI0018F3EFA5|nr:2-keto-4-pentenoate hydratase [Sandaracinobacteroides hominis]
MSAHRSAATAAQLDAIAERFVGARRGRTAIVAYPGLPPVTEADAYAIQRHAISLWPDRVAGWKVGLIPPPFSQQLGRTRLFGPVFSKSVQTAGEDIIEFVGIAGGFTAFEAEYVLALGTNVQPATGWTAERAATVVGAVHVGVEIAGSPFAGINEHGPLVTISDFGNNAGLLLGAEISGGIAALAHEACTVRIDGAEVGRGTPASVPGTPLESLAELLNHMGRSGQTLVAGTLVSTGAATGVHQVFNGQSAVADFGPQGKISVRIVEA